MGDGPAGCANGLRKGGMGPEDINLVECHDAFTISEILHYEALGLCPPGEGGRLVDEGAVALEGRVPVNPSGGLLSRGHPVGATGVAQIVEVVAHSFVVKRVPVRWKGPGVGLGPVHGPGTRTGTPNRAPSPSFPYEAGGSS